MALPAPLAARLLLGAPLVVVPALLAALPERRLAGLPLAGGAGTTWLALTAALPLLAAFGHPAGPLALVLALPWVGLCCLLALAALLHALAHLTQLLLRPAQAPQLATDVALGLLGVGGLFLFAERLGVGMLGFGSLAMLLGAVHYHFLGFGLLALLAGSAGRHTRLAYLATFGIAGGMALAAAGMAGQLVALNWLGVQLIGLAGLGAVALLLTRARAAGLPAGLLLGLSAVLLALGLSLGIGWSSSHFAGFAFLDLEAMIRVHGSLNASAIVLAALAGLAERRAA